MQLAPIIRAQSVHKSFRSGNGSVLSILRDLNWEVLPGSRVAILGPSGSGKSTILNLLGALDVPDSGQVWVDGTDLNTLDERALASWRNEKIGFVFQSHHLLSHCTVLENVLVPVLANRSETPPAFVERAERLLVRMGLKDRMNHRPAQLSGGESQRVAVVRSLIMSPKLILADEPTGALDRTSASDLVHLLVELNQETQVTLVVVTHSTEVAQEMGESFELQNGTLEVLRRG
jgi:lipoprotein-releasing system ATP-binding protein